MPDIPTMTLDDIQQSLVHLRQRKRQLTQTGKAAARKIITLAKRRERLLAKVNILDDQIAALRAEAPAAPAPRKRGRPAKASSVSI